MTKSIDAFTVASDAGTKELAKWSEQTAKWTRWLPYATVALYAAAVVQIIVVVSGK